ncbi:MAG: hypothetical protein DDT32_01922 [Syntrophomonadaceae bacterium]|nr:hypothetical protein [Bacillota bacterium]
MDRFKVDRNQPILSWVNEFYKKVFPGITQCSFITNPELQKAGIDKILRYKKSSLRQSITVDEKIRYKFYDDVLLEEYSNFEKQSPGWLSINNTLCDYISYIFRNEKIVYLFAYKDLKKSWDRNYERWLENYGRKFGKTEDRFGRVLYRTSNIPVPLTELEVGYIFCKYDPLNKEFFIKRLKGDHKA